ncbi:MAG: hypothetical protein MJZ56_06360 [Bacteroidales bacterium]|nr:hypothetical protein [Bacteroidales bacterium]
MKKALLIMAAALMALCVSCKKDDDKSDGGGGGGNSHYSDSQFVGSYMNWDSENEWFDRIYGIYDSYAALCSARDTYISQGNWELANNIQNEIDMLLDEEFLAYVDVIDISNGRFRFSTGYLYFNYESSNDVYKEIDCNLAGMNFTVSIVVNDWNVRQYSVGDGGSCLIVKDDYAVSPYVYPTENNKGIIWCECKYYTIDWWFANFR